MVWHSSILVQRSNLPKAEACTSFALLAHGLFFFLKKKKERKKKRKKEREKKAKAGLALGSVCESLLLPFQQQIKQIFLPFSLQPPPN